MNANELLVGAGRPLRATAAIARSRGALRGAVDAARRNDCDARGAFVRERDLDEHFFVAYREAYVWNYSRQSTR